MSELVAAKYAGIAGHLPRPGQAIRAAHLSALLAGQAGLYEALTNDEQPGSTVGSTTGTAHIHGLNPLPHPLAVQYGPINLPRRSAAADLVSGGTDYAGFYPYWLIPIFVPAGSASALVLVTGANLAYDVGSLRFGVLNSSLVEVTAHNEGYSTDGFFAAPGVETIAFNVDFTAGAVNVLSCEAWDGFHNQTTPPNEAGPVLHPERRIDSIVVLPTRTQGRGASVPSRFASPVASANVSRPAAFLPNDDGQVSDDMPVSSAILNRALLNDALLYEILTGNPAGNNASASRTGHNHADDAAGDDGPPIEHALISMGLGTLRAPPVEGAGDAAWSYLHNPGGDSLALANVWDGQGAIAPMLISTTTATILGRYYFRMPTLRAALRADATGNISCVALVFNNSGGDADLDVRLLTADLGTAFATRSVTVSSAAGVQLVTVNGLEADAFEGDHVVELSLDPTTAKAASLAVVGFAVYFNP